MDPEIVLYGTTWCYETFRSRKILDKYKIPYQWIDIDSNGEGRKFVEQTNHGMRSVPTIVFPDGSILVEPSDDELMIKLGVKQKA
jgi:mycoredoxin